MGTFFLKLVKPTKHNTLFLIGALCGSFFLPPVLIDDGTLGFGRDCIYNSVGALGSFCFLFGCRKHSLFTRFL